MSKHIIKPNTKKEKKRIFWNYFLVFAGLILLGLSFFYEGSGLSKFANLIVSLNVLFYGINPFIRKQNDFYIDISSECITWLAYNKESGKKFVYWNDIRWMRKEKDNGITMFEDSSFENFISLAPFEESERMQIINEVLEKAKIHTIRLVNF